MKEFILFQGVLMKYLSLAIIAFMCMCNYSCSDSEEEDKGRDGFGVGGSLP